MQNLSYMARKLLHAALALCYPEKSTGRLIQEQSPHGSLDFPTSVCWVSHAGRCQNDSVHLCLRPKGSNFSGFFEFIVFFSSKTFEIGISQKMEKQLITHTHTHTHVCIQVYFCLVAMSATGV